MEGSPPLAKLNQNSLWRLPLGDVSEELYCDGGQLPLHQRQLSSWAANAPFQATRGHGLAALHVGGYAMNLDIHAHPIIEGTSAPGKGGGSSLDNFVGNTSARLQMYPPDVQLHAEKMYNKHPVLSYLPCLASEKSGGELNHVYAHMGAHVGRERNCTQTAISIGPHAWSFGTSIQSPNFSYPEDVTPGSASDTQSPKLIESPKAVMPLHYFDPYTYAHNSLQSLARLAAEWEPDAVVPSLQAVVDGGKHVHRQNAGACMFTDSSLGSSVTGISSQQPSVLVDPHVTDCVNVASVTLHQVHEAILTEKLDAITHNDRSNVLHPMDMSCPDGVDINTFCKSNKYDENGDLTKSSLKESNDSESQIEDLVNQHHFSQRFCAKRSRAAEKHNKSERKRREKINEKLKVLQKLLPNANKTDKASLLGEAIEYLKSLQAQLMVMSYVTGIDIPPMLMSQGMLDSCVFPHMGMEFRAGLLTNANDASAATPAPSWMCKASSLKPLMPLPASPSSAKLVETGNVGLASPAHHLQMHTMPVHHKAPFSL